LRSFTEFFHFPRYPWATFGSVWSFGVLVDHGTAAHVHESWIHCVIWRDRGSRAWKKTWELIPGCLESHPTTAVASSSLSRLAGNLIVCSRRKAGSRQVSQYCQMRDGSKRSGRGFVCDCFSMIKARQLLVRMRFQ
jgi:hypothetical protein